MTSTPGRPAAQGAILALLAATLFGASTPLLQRFGEGVGSWTTAALLYAGAATAGLLARSSAGVEASLRRSHVPRLALMALVGGVLAPVALAWGLQHTNGMVASLMLTLEAVFTALLAFLFYREQFDRRVALAMGLLTAGGMLLVLDRAGSGTTQVMGLVAVVVATFAWGLDNTLSRALAHLDPGRVVSAKAATGAACSFFIAWLAGESMPSVGSMLALFLTGALGYGLSLRFYLLAQRAFGATRTGSIFATAPFIGAAVALALGERGISIWLAAGAALMIAGVLLHILEKHAHIHEHEAMEHEHAHIHEDGHHEHVHDPAPIKPHSHRHRHEPQAHVHPHAPDLHHDHRH